MANLGLGGKPPCTRRPDAATAPPSQSCSLAQRPSGRQLMATCSTRPPSSRTGTSISHSLPLLHKTRERSVRGSRICSSEGKDAEYNQQMQQQMGWEHLNPYEYHYDRGLYYHEIVPNLICGSQPRNPGDIDQIKHQVRANRILNLQQDKDLQYWNVDFHALQRRADEQGIALVRRPARDFDPDSLRSMLPAVVQVIDAAMTENQRLYVHCTAGLGRAPAACIAYLYWFCDMGLDQAYKHLTDIRPCGPKRDAIRGATYDLMSGGDWHHFGGLPADAYASLNQNDRHAVQSRVRSWKS